MTYTYAILEISPAAYDEIRAKLVEAGYSHAFHEHDGREVIDMQGLAVAARVGDDPPPEDDPGRVIKCG